MQTFIVSVFASDHSPNSDLTVVITPPLGLEESSIVIRAHHNWLDHPFVTAQFEIQRRFKVGRCHGSRPLLEPETHGVLVGEIDFDSKEG